MRSARCSRSLTTRSLRVHLRTLVSARARISSHCTARCSTRRTNCLRGGRVNGAPWAISSRTRAWCPAVSATVAPPRAHGSELGLRSDAGCAYPAFRAVSHSCARCCCAAPDIGTGPGVAPSARSDCTHCSEPSSQASVSNVWPFKLVRSNSGAGMSASSKCVGGGSFRLES
eukprot:scaffold12038_cov61-Phaeocystis_antarctica.AAC.5